MRYDDIVTELGEFGPYQKRIYFLVCLCAIPSGLQTLATVFSLLVPDHRCAVPGLENDTYISQGQWHDDLINHTIPWDHGEGAYSGCNVYTQGDDGNYYTNMTSECSRYVYDTSDMERTLIMDLDLVCDKVNMRTWGNMVYMAGMLFGSLVMGTLSDIIGRKKVMMISIFGIAGSSLGVAFVDNFTAYVVLRFFTSFSGSGLFLTAFVIGMELVGPSKRKYAGIIIEMFWCVGLFVLCGINYALRDWRWSKIATSAPIFLYVSFFWLMPESTRWLIHKGRLDEARVILEKVAKVNKVTLSEKVLSLQDIEREGQGEKVWHMFTTPRLLIRCLIIFLNWSVASMVYYGLSLNVGALSGDVFLNFTISTIMELASYFFCLFLLDVWGRKALQCFSCFLGGIACIGTMFPVIFGWPDWITITLSMIGKFGASAAFAVIYVFSAELFPTCVRNSGMGVSSMSARVGGVLAPYVADLGGVVEGDLGVALPLIIFGGLCVAGGITALWLPETLNKKLPDTVEDAKTFGTSEGNKKNNYTLEFMPPDSKAAKDNISGTYNPAFTVETS